MDEFTLGTIDSLAYQVERGVKPAAEATVKADKAMEYVSFLHRNRKVICCVEECATAPGWSFVWMMKDARMLDVIIQRPLEPKSAADHFYLGALFGYSNTAILDFVEKWSKNDIPPTPHNY